MDTYLQVDPQEFNDGILELGLHVSKALVDLIPQDLSKHADVIVKVGKLVQGLNDGACMLNDQTLEPIPMDRWTPPLNPLRSVKITR